MAYLLDANIFIQAKNLHYGLDFCPAFWDWLIKREWREAGSSASRKVGDEIAAIADELSAWARSVGRVLPRARTRHAARAHGLVSLWANAAGYEAAAVNTFLQVADYYLVAHALAHGHTVVTPRIASTSLRRDQDS